MTIPSVVLEGASKSSRITFVDISGAGSVGLRPPGRRRCFRSVPAVKHWWVALAACVLGLFASAPSLDAQTAVAPQGGAAVVGTVGAGADAAGQEPAQAQAAGEKKKQSPWLLTPLVSSSPKMGTSIGALGAYLHYFDPESQVSMFGAMYQYSTTNSMFGGVFARTSFRADHHRLEGFAGFGYVENEYADYAGTGKTLLTNDDIRMAAGRYLYRFKGNWFVGTQAVFANYEVTGPTEQDAQILAFLGITGFNSGGVGLAVMHDSRDNQDMPEKGWYANAFNIANSRFLGAEEDYDIYRVDSRWFWGHGNGHVLAVRQNNQFTVGAPTSAEATILLRGYKLAQYLGKYMSSIEVEERVRFSRRWGATLFAGAGWLYGGSSGLVDSDGTYPSYGGGIHFVLKPEDHMLLNLEYAYGNSDNQGIYLTFGYSW